jgi:ribosomal protein S18 acetylase RimI-like enzyme
VGGAATITAISAEETHPLRAAVLRPHDPADVVWPNDDAPGTLHVAARDDAGQIVGVATVAREPHRSDPRPGDWRIRGMATAPAARGRGIATALLQACLEHARAAGGARAWCTARTGAVRLYERAGFVAEGDVFEVPHIGPHLLMTRPLD